MSLWGIAWNYLWDRWFTTVLTILSVALAVGLISALLTVRNETKKRFEEETSAYDIVVGPPGSSPLQIVLNAIYYLNNPTGYLLYSDYERLKEEEDVAYAFPVMLGDTYKKFRIVGTVTEIFEYPWTSDSTLEKRYPFKLKKGDEGGRFFETSMEAVLGYRVALETGLGIGDTFSGWHGTMAYAEYDHGDSEYTVVGIMQPSATSNDRAIFVNMESVWEQHDDDEIDEKRITAVLIDLYSSSVRFTFHGKVREDYQATPAIPVNEISNLYNKLLEPAVVILMAVGYVVVAISSLSIMIGLYLSIIQRKRDLAIMRALGASAFDIFGAVMIEALMVTLIGIVTGWALGKAVAIGLGAYMSQNYGFTMHGISTSPEEFKFFAMVAFVGLVAGIVPAWQAYQADIAEDLQST